MVSWSLSDQTAEIAGSLLRSRAALLFAAVGLKSLPFPALPTVIRAHMLVLLFLLPNPLLVMLSHDSRSDHFSSVALYASPLQLLPTLGHAVLGVRLGWCNG